MSAQGGDPGATFGETPGATALGGRSRARLGAEIAIASFLVLFQELALIRWLPGQVRVLAYFPNLILVSAFLGIGVGCLRAGQRPLLALWPLGVLAVAGLGFALSGVVFTQSSPSEMLWLLYYDLPTDAPLVEDVRPPIVLFFLASAASFVPLGQAVAERLQELRRRGVVLWGYSADLAGSLVGVVAFAVVGFSGAFPVVWFALLFLAGALLFAGRPRRLALYAAVAAACVGVVHVAERSERYSPYYALRTMRAESLDQLAVLTNGSLHQIAFDVATRDPGDDYTRAASEGFRRAYAYLPHPPQVAVAVGAGTGNDVAALLDIGAERVIAVEIDPAILEIGRGHPNRPYDSPRVQAVNTDARAFLNDSRDAFDLIVFGTLDSMTRLSALSSVRLDTFMYTVDCFRAARARLKPDGGLIVFYRVAADFIDNRLYGMLTEAFGQAPLVLTGEFRLFNRAYLIGPAFEHASGAERREVARRMLEKTDQNLEIPTDDWPFLYLRERGISGFYASLIAVFSVLAAAAVFGASPAMRRGLREIDGQMFLFGLGFLLLETRAVTEMNLVWGATWITSAVVFGSILATILAATLVTEIRRLPYMLGMAGLIASLAVMALVPTHVLISSAVTTKLALSIAYVGTPIFFASVCFASLLRSREQADRAFGWNLLGAVAGGLLEITSMALGMRALLLVAGVAYVGAALLWFGESRRAARDGAA